MENTDLTTVQQMLGFIDPDDYDTYMRVGMALKDEGFEQYVWDEWAARSSKFDQRVSDNKWRSFQSSGVTIATICHMAMEHGYRPPHRREEIHALGWTDAIREDAPDNRYRLFDPDLLIQEQIKEPTAENWNRQEEIKTYLRAVFEPDDIVGYVTRSLVDENGNPTGAPDRGSYHHTQAELIERIDRYKDSKWWFDEVFSTSFSDSFGAFFRINPLDGEGVYNDNVVKYRHVLVEGDNQSVEEQLAIIKKLRLPASAIVHSGNKSIHAIVRVDAPTIKEYKERFEYIKNVCEKNGLIIDRACRNPSRLSRMPGVTRNGKKQFLIATHIGCRDFKEWQNYIEELNDNMPDIESMVSLREENPPLNEELIKGIVRVGHKMLLTGPSKAGKSFALIELAIALSKGGMWFGRWPCRKSKVLYINLEIDRPSVLKRFNDVDRALGGDGDFSAIDIWNLRGSACPLDQLTPKLIRRARERHYDAVIIDPIYKVITGDENSASDMAKFCNEFDKISKELNTTVIYCHHHSKGDKRLTASIDRSSGSGVFGRDPDAIIDMTEIKRNEIVMNSEFGEKGITAWVVSYTLRDFESPDKEYYFFRYPIHVFDEGRLCEQKAENEGPGRKKSLTVQDVDSAIRNLIGIEDEVTPKRLTDYFTYTAPDGKPAGPSEKTVRRRLSESENYSLVNGRVVPK